jgi:predicted TIM-barrel fold metal-dependent hydrolase
VAADIIGAEKILFGSDFPLIRPGRGLQEMAESGLRPEETAWIQGRNAMGLLKLNS